MSKLEDGFDVKTKRGESFGIDMIQHFDYNDLYRLMSSVSFGFALRDPLILNDAKNLSMKDDIVPPEFYSKFARMERAVLMQGQKVMNQAHYNRQESLFCVVDGFAELRLVPHIYRQQVYAPQTIKNEQIKDILKEFTDPGELNEVMTDEVAWKRFVRLSPVNFFEPDLSKYPAFAEIGEHLYSVELAKGDCLFIPAFVYHQVYAYGDEESEVAKSRAKNRTGEKPLATMVSMIYESNSRNLLNFYDALEINLLK